MLITCWSAKGGSGVSTVAALLALYRSRRDGGALIVDLCGDQPDLLGASGIDGPGVTDWLAAADDVDDRALHRLAIDVGDGLSLIPAGSGAADAPGRADQLATALTACDRTVIVDAGCIGPDDLGTAACTLAAAATHSFLVTRACYLALRRARAAPLTPSGVVLLTEPGRVLGRTDVETIIGVSVRTEIAIDPAVARVVDAGLLRCRLPKGLDRAVLSAA